MSKSKEADPFFADSSMRGLIASLQRIINKEPNASFRSSMLYLAEAYFGIRAGYTNCTPEQIDASWQRVGECLSQIPRVTALLILDAEFGMVLLEEDEWVIACDFRSAVAIVQEKFPELWDATVTEEDLEDLRDIDDMIRWQAQREDQSRNWVREGVPESHWWWWEPFRARGELEA